jgi:hypothetical protein
VNLEIVLLVVAFSVLSGTASAGLWYLTHLQVPRRTITAAPTQTDAGTALTTRPEVR